jgi:type VI secretion system protein VasG
LGRIQRRIQTNHGLEFDYDDGVVQLIVSRCTELESGGRMIDAILTNTLLPRISLELLSRKLDGRSLASIRVSADNGEFAYQLD